MVIRLPSAVELVRPMVSMYRRGNWDGLRSCYHEDALLCTLSSGTVPVSGDETIELLQEHEKTLFELSEELEFVRFDEDACVVEGRARYPLEGGGFADSHIFWLFTFKDGLMYRSAFFHSRSEAYRAYLEHGVTLGISGD
jgi:hypothetical protein